MAKLVSKTYGDALFEAAVEEGALDALFAEAEGVLAVLEANEEYIKLLSHPKLAAAEKVSLLENAFQGQISDNMMGFLVAIVEKDRFAEVKEILQYFIGRVMEEKKIGVARVTCATELSEGQKQQIESKLHETTDYSGFRMNYQVDSSLIGGMVIQIGDRVVDSSVRTKLANMAKDLQKIRL